MLERAHNINQEKTEQYKEMDRGIQGNNKIILVRLIDSSLSTVMAQLLPGFLNYCHHGKNDF